MKILIIGAGPCGLGAAYRLHRLGHRDWQVYERCNHVGGLSASFADRNGFTWDVGGHVLFSHYDYFDRVIEESLGDACFEHQRESWIRILKRWVPYPFQNNVRYLPDEALHDCLEGLRNLRGKPEETAHFKEWMDAVFGHGVVNYFMEPYNRKVWGTPLEMMSREWIAERVSVVDLARIERNIAEQRDDVGWGPNNTFKFPKHGGTGAIYEGVASRFSDRIHLEYEMRSIDLDKKLVSFTNGRVESFDVLLTTTPLDLLVKSSLPVPEPVRAAADDLVHNSGLIVGLGFRGKRVDPKCWMYFPEPDCPFYRVTNFHNYSRYNVPEGDIDACFSQMCETTYSEYKPESRDTIVENTIHGLISSGMISMPDSEQIVSRYLIDVPYSYPVPTLKRDKALQTIQPYLESKDVYSRGRFGAWKYEVGNMDHSFMQGVEVIDKLLNNTQEKTVAGAP